MGKACTGRLTSNDSGTRKAIGKHGAAEIPPMHRPTKSAARDAEGIQAHPVGGVEFFGSLRHDPLGQLLLSRRVILGDWLLRERKRRLHLRLLQLLQLLQLRLLQLDLLL